MTDKPLTREEVEALLAGGAGWCGEETFKRLCDSWLAQEQELRAVDAVAYNYAEPIVTLAARVQKMKDNLLYWHSTASEAAAREAIIVHKLRRAYGGIVALPWDLSAAAVELAKKAARCERAETALRHRLGSDCIITDCPICEEARSIIEGAEP